MNTNKKKRGKKRHQKEENTVEYSCQMCGKKYKKRKGNFTPSNSILYAGSDGYINTCKSCIDELFVNYTAFYGGNEEKATERICQLFDFYFNKSALKSAQKTSGDRSRISVYMSKIQIKPHTGKTYIDTIKEQLQRETMDTVNVPQ